MTESGMHATPDPADSLIPSMSLDSPSDNAMTALYRVALGPVNKDYYLPVFAHFDDTGRTTTSWNWAASLCTLNWMVFRQMWSALLVYVAAAEGLALLVFGFGRQFLDWPQGVVFGVLAAFVVLAFAVPGLYGNAILHADTRRRIARALAASRTVPEACALLDQRASSRKRLQMLVAANVAIAVVALAAYLALPREGFQAGTDTTMAPSVTVAQAASAAAVASAARVASAPATQTTATAMAEPPAPEKATPAPTAATAASEPATQSAAVPTPAAASAPSSLHPAPGPPALPRLPSPRLPHPRQRAHHHNGQHTPSRAQRQSPAAADKAKDDPPRTAAAAKNEKSASLTTKAETPASKPAAPAAKAEKTEKAAKTDTAASKPAPTTERPSRTPPATTATAASASVTASRAPAPAASAAQATASTSASTAPEPASSIPPAVGSTAGYYINVGLFADEANARKAQARLLNEGLPAFRQELNKAKGRRIRVRVGPYESRAQADTAAQAIRALDLEAVVFRQ